MDDFDHRVLGNRLDLFHQQEEGPGMVFWHPRGFAVYSIIEDYIRRRMRGAGFQEVRTPQLLSRALWEVSGHWEKFAGDMFVVVDDERSYALKPMSCPGHIQIFKNGIRSFRELPMRLCEFGVCHRNEPSGTLHGLFRARSFEQDDAHIFCAPEDLEAEVTRFCSLLGDVYRDFGFPDFGVGFSTRPATRLGADAVWDMAEAALERAASAAGLKCERQEGEGAFYGPKLEFFLRDRHGRNWQCGTVQLDFVLPERMGAEYVDSSGQRCRPVLIHHAILGTLERFIGILLEHHRGNLPAWLAPDQVYVANITEQQAAYAERVAATLRESGLRVKLDLSAERLGRKVVAARESCTPIFVAVGASEERDNAVAVRRKDGRQRIIPLAEAVAALREETAAP